jgi:uncharacterized protein YciI
MSTYAVQYFYAAPEEQLATIRPEHRAFLGQLGTDGVLLVSGPMVDYPGALLIFQADSPEALSALLDQDPFDIAGFIGERTINEWNPILGKWVLG